MKRIEILSDCFVPSDVEGEVKTAYAGSIIDLEDAAAGNVVAAQRGRYADKGTKLVDTTKQHEAAQEKRAAKQLDPLATMAAAFANAMRAEAPKAEKPAT